MLRADPPLLALAVCLSALAGFVDALGFLHAGGFFVSFMSGNSTRLAVGIAAQSSAALVAIALIAGFVVGVMFGAVIGHMAGPARRPVVLLAVTMLLIAAALLGATYPRLAIALMVLAMGTENAALADNGEIKVGLTYMTGALVRVGQALGNRLLGVSGAPWASDLALWIGLVSGAVSGALVYRQIGMDALWLASAIAAALTLAAWRMTRAKSPA